jgi:hypothetical protein
VSNGTKTSEEECNEGESLTLLTETFGIEVRSILKAGTAIEEKKKRK